MSANEERVRGLVAQQAADWFVANRAGLSPRERDTFIAWLKASPVHVEEYLSLTVIARDLRQASEHSHAALDQLIARARHEDSSPVEPFWPRVMAAVATVAAGRRWQHAAVTVAALGVGALAVLLLWSRMPIPRGAAPPGETVLHFATRHGELETERLADDSVLHLNTDSAVTVRLRANERLIELTAGEADFEVSHDPERPWRVSAGAAHIVDLGTRFDVRLERDSTLVTVLEGRVAVGLFPPSRRRAASADRDHGGSPTVQVGANEQIRVSASDWPATLVAVDAQRSTAWLHRQISFDHEPLERVAREFNRYSPTPIEITSPALRNLEISGVFSTDDIDAFIAFLRSLDGVRVVVTPDRIRVSQN